MNTNLEASSPGRVLVDKDPGRGGLPRGDQAGPGGGTRGRGSGPRPL